MSTFDAMIAAVTNQRRVYLTRAHAIDATIPSSVEMIETYGYGDPGDGGHAYYDKRAATSPGGFQSAGGQWWGIVPLGDFRLEQFGGQSKTTEPQRVSGVVNATDNWQAWQDAVACMSIVHSAPKTIAGARIELLYGWYYFSDTINNNKTIQVYGKGKHLATTLWFATNKNGIINNTDDTFGAGLLIPPGGTAGWSKFSDFSLACEAGTVGHGFWMRAGCIIERIWAEQWPNNGFHICATKLDDPPTSPQSQGNANSFLSVDCEASTCGHDGMYIDWKDANAGTSINFKAQACERVGLRDRSFLGNTHIGPVLQSNGFGGQVHHLGKRYYYKGGPTSGINVGGVGGSMLSGGGNVTPGTDETVWGYIEDGGVHSLLYKQWVSGTTYHRGAPWIIEGTSNASTVIGAYTEGAQPHAYMDQCAVIIGGTQATPVAGVGIYINKQQLTGILRAPGTPDAVTGQAIRTSIGYSSPDESWRMDVDGDHPSGYAMTWIKAESVWAMRHGRSSGTTPVRYTTDPNTVLPATSPITGGRSVVIPAGHIAFARGIWRGASTNSLRYETNGTAAPTTGEWGRGDIVWNLNPSASATPGWMCVVAGTPGTWKAMANLAA